MALPLATSLTDYAKRHSGTETGDLEQSYRNTIYCGGLIIQEDGKLRSRYCGNRWCPVCNRIRMGKAINAYMPIVEEWSDPHLVTLTVANIKGDDLSGLIDRMTYTFSQVTRRIQRSGLKPKMVRKLECTWNAARGDFHPHFHVITEDAELAHLLQSTWEEYAPKRTGQRVSSKGQDVRRIDRDGLIEVFKYVTKLTAKGAAGERVFVSVPALDVIFRAMRRRRVYQPYGFRVSKDTEEVKDLDAEVDATTRAQERIMWLWDQDMADWIDHETGECLTGHTRVELTPHALESSQTGDFEEVPTTPPYEEPEASRAMQGRSGQRPAPRQRGPLHAPNPAPLPQVGLISGRESTRP